MKDQILVSIIVPLYNKEPYFERCFNSVAKQTYKNIECIIVEDCSTDNSLALAESLIKNYAGNIKFALTKHERNGGLSVARNTGIDHSKGKYLYFLDSDDEITENCINSLVTEVEKYPEVDIVQGNMYQCPRVKKDVYNLKGKLPEFIKGNLDINYLKFFPINAVNKLIRREFITQNHLYFKAGIIHEDYHWRFFAMKKIESFAFTDDYCYIRYFVSGSIMMNRDLFSSISSYLTIAEDMLDNLDVNLQEKQLPKARRLLKRLRRRIRSNEKYSSLMPRCEALLAKAANGSSSFFLNVKWWVRQTLFYWFKGFFESGRPTQSVRVCFTNFWKSFEPRYLGFILKALDNNCLRFRVVKKHKPDIQIFSVFGNVKKIKKSKAPVKIFYTGENVNDRFISYRGNCIDCVDLSLGFDYMEADNYLRYPLWLLYFFHSDNSKDEIKRILNNCKQLYEKPNFCSLIARHDKNGLRTKIYNDVSKIANVDCPGKLLHNDDTLLREYHDNKSQYLQQYKFSICPENSVSEGYVTEKIFQSLFSGCIPIYNGWSKNPEPDIINPNIILWYDESDEQNNRYILNEVKKLHENDKLYRSFANQSFFCDTAVDKIYDIQNQFNEKMLDTLVKKHFLEKKEG